jgi:superfamily II DNA or RNA helicase
VFDEIVYEYGIKEGVDNRYLCELDAIRVKTTISLDGVRTTGGELNQKDLAEEINTPQRNQLVVSSYLKYASGRQGIFFCVDIDHAIKLADMFNEMGVKCAAISSDEELTPDRSNNISRYKRGEITVLTNVMVLTTGFDAPDTGVIGHASPTKSLTKYLQCTGRGTRLKSKEFVDKFGQNCIILDFMDSTNRHNLVNSWNLDKDKHPEERVFITKEKKEKLLASRKAKLEHERKEDEKVSLLRIPKFKISNSIKMTEEATSAQLKWVYDLGYPQDVHYTKKMCSEIISQQPATAKQIALLKHHNYDVTNKVITIGDVNAAMWEVKQKLNKK